MAVDSRMGRGRLVLALVGVVAACQLAPARSLVDSSAAPRGSSPSADARHLYLEFGFGGRYLGNEEVFGNVTEHGAASASLAWFGAERLGLEGGGSISFPSGSDTGAEISGDVVVEEDAYMSELWLGPTLRLTEPGSPFLVRAGAGPTWTRAEVSRTSWGATVGEEEDSARSLGFYVHLSFLFELRLSHSSPLLLGLDLRAVTGTEMEFFGEDFPRVDGDADYVQFLLVFGWAL